MKCYFASLLSMKNKIIVHVISLIMLQLGTLAIAVPIIPNMHVPFQEFSIPAKTSLIIDYANEGNWDAIVCGCFHSRVCTSYVAVWQFKGNKVISTGPNYNAFLELYMGLPPECPEQNADKEGKIKISNTGNTPLSFSCFFTALGP
jgi:hypothetical protein